MLTDGTHTSNSSDPGANGKLFALYDVFPSTAPSGLYPEDNSKMDVAPDDEDEILLYGGTLSGRMPQSVSDGVGTLHGALATTQPAADDKHHSGSVRLSQASASAARKPGGSSSLMRGSTVSGSQGEALFAAPLPPPVTASSGSRDATGRSQFFGASQHNAVMIESLMRAPANTKKVSAALRRKQKNAAHLKGATRRLRVTNHSRITEEVEIDLLLGGGGPHANDESHQPPLSSGAQAVAIVEGTHPTPASDDERVNQPPPSALSLFETKTLGLLYVRDDTEHEYRRYYYHRRITPLAFLFLGCSAVNMISMYASRLAEGDWPMVLSKCVSGSALLCSFAMFALSALKRREMLPPTWLTDGGKRIIGMLEVFSILLLIHWYAVGIAWYPFAVFRTQNGHWTSFFPNVLNIASTMVIPVSTLQFTSALMLRLRGAWHVPLLFFAPIPLFACRLAFEGHQVDATDNVYLNIGMSVASSLCVAVLLWMMDVTSRQKFEDSLALKADSRKVLLLQRKLDTLLDDLMPPNVWHRLHLREPVVDKCQQGVVSIMELYDFAVWSTTVLPKDAIEIVSMLHKYLDKASNTFQVTKMKVSGDQYVVISGLVEDSQAEEEERHASRLSDNHSHRGLLDLLATNDNQLPSSELCSQDTIDRCIASIEFCFAARQVLDNILMQGEYCPEDNAPELHAVSCCGSVFGAVIGSHRTLTYDVFGPTVDYAQKLLQLVPSDSVGCNAAVVKCVRDKAKANPSEPSPYSIEVVLVDDVEITTVEYAGEDDEEDDDSPHEISQDHALCLPDDNGAEGVVVNSIAGGDEHEDQGLCSAVGNVAAVDIEMLGLHVANDLHTDAVHPSVGNPLNTDSNSTARGAANSAPREDASSRNDQLSRMRAMQMERYAAVVSLVQRAVDGKHKRSSSDNVDPQSQSATEKRLLDQSRGGESSTNGFHQSDNFATFNGITSTLRRRGVRDADASNDLVTLFGREVYIECVYRLEREPATSSLCVGSSSRGKFVDRIVEERFQSFLLYRFSPWRKWIFNSFLMYYSCCLLAVIPDLCAVKKLLGNGLLSTEPLRTCSSVLSMGYWYCGVAAVCLALFRAFILPLTPLWSTGISETRRYFGDAVIFALLSFVSLQSLAGLPINTLNCDFEYLTLMLSFCAALFSPYVRCTAFLSVFLLGNHLLGTYRVFGGFPGPAGPCFVVAVGMLATFSTFLRESYEREHFEAVCRSEALLRAAEDEVFLIRSLQSMVLPPYLQELLAAGIHQEDKAIRYEDVCFLAIRFDDSNNRLVNSVYVDPASAIHVMQRISEFVDSVLERAHIMCGFPILKGSLPDAAPKCSVEHQGGEGEADDGDEAESKTFLLHRMSTASPDRILLAGFDYLPSNEQDLTEKSAAEAALMKQKHLQRCVNVTFQMLLMLADPRIREEIPLSYSAVATVGPAWGKVFGSTMLSFHLLGQGPRHAGALSVAAAANFVGMSESFHRVAVGPQRWSPNGSVTGETHSIGVSEEGGDVSPGTVGVGGGSSLLPNPNEGLVANAHEGHVANPEDLVLLPRVQPTAEFHVGASPSRSNTASAQRGKWLADLQRWRVRGAGTCIMFPVKENSRDAMIRILGTSYNSSTKSRFKKPQPVSHSVVHVAEIHRRGLLDRPSPQEVVAEEDMKRYVVNTGSAGITVAACIPTASLCALRHQEAGDDETHCEEDEAPPVSFFSNTYGAT